MQTEEPIEPKITHPSQINKHDWRLWMMRVFTRPPVAPTDKKVDGYIVYSDGSLRKDPNAQ